MTTTCVAGIGNEMRHDDGVGPVVASRVARGARASSSNEEREILALASPLVEPLDLVGHWEPAELAVVIDAVRSGCEPGTLTLTWLGTDAAALPGGQPPRPSTHGLGVAEVFRLSQTLGNGPLRVALIGVEGEDFSPGPGLSPLVQAGAARATALAMEICRAARRVAPALAQRPASAQAAP